MEEIPKDIVDFARLTASNFEQKIISVRDVFMSKVSGEPAAGIGFCTKHKTKALTHKQAGKDRILVEFNVSDGENTIECIAHNAEEKYLLGGLDADELTTLIDNLDESQKMGSKLEIYGSYVNNGAKRVFLVDTLCLDAGFMHSQMTPEQFAEFKRLCHENDTSPLALMMRDDTLWAELYAKDYLKKAILLFCLSPERKQDMIHIGIVSSHGEGKDHLVERVIEPLVPCRLVGSGKMATIPGLFGAMSGDDLSCLEVGLLPKMNHQRVAISEFQTWEDSTFGELMNMMANGSVSIQKGNLDVTRETTENLLFLGNPPTHYDPEESESKKDMLAAFGKYTHQIVSRLSLIFTQLSLAGDEATGMIRNAILRAMDRDFDNADIKEALDMWRKFFREYLAYVSHLRPNLREYAARINSNYDVLENKTQFKAAFNIRNKRDNRKYQEFANLVRGFARLQGDEQIGISHVGEAYKIFSKSLTTLTDDFPIKAMEYGVDIKIIDIHGRLLSSFGGGNAVSKEDMRKKIKFTEHQLSELQKFKAILPFSDGTYLIRDFNWDTMEDSS
jgi:DNA replicative helicase MCM subunit Mcm2 (Cdc46/Mcm family)